MSFKKATLADAVNFAVLLIKSISRNQDVLEKVGLDHAYAASIKDLKNKLEESEARQERLKAELKSATCILRQDLKELKKVTGKARKLIKAELPMPRWKEFGIDAQR